MDIFSFRSTISGNLGEGFAGKRIRRLISNGYPGYQFDNLYLPKENGDYSEIDLAFVTLKGIFVFECKNYSGWIYGSEYSKTWTVSYSKERRYQFYNPVMQNEMHIKELKKFIGKDIPCYSIIVFCGDSEFKKIDVNPRHAKVIHLDDLYGTIEKLWPLIPDCISEEKASETIELLKCFTEVKYKTKKLHKEHIQIKNNNDAKP